MHQIFLGPARTWVITKTKFLSQEMDSGLSSQDGPVTVTAWPCGNFSGRGQADLKYGALQATKSLRFY